MSKKHRRKNPKKQQDTVAPDRSLVKATDDPLVKQTPAPVADHKLERPRVLRLMKWFALSLPVIWILYQASEKVYFALLYTPTFHLEVTDFLLADKVDRPVPEFSCSILIAAKSRMDQTLSFDSIRYSQYVNTIVVPEDFKSFRIAASGQGIHKISVSDPGLEEWLAVPPDSEFISLVVYYHLVGATEGKLVQVRDSQISKCFYCLRPDFGDIPEECRRRLIFTSFGGSFYWTDSTGRTGETSFKSGEISVLDRCLPFLSFTSDLDLAKEGKLISVRSDTFIPRYGGIFQSYSDSVSTDSVSFSTPAEIFSELSPEWEKRFAGQFLELPFKEYENFAYFNCRPSNSFATLQKCLENMQFYLWIIAPDSQSTSRLNNTMTDEGFRGEIRIGPAIKLVREFLYESTSDKECRANFEDFMLSHESGIAEQLANNGYLIFFVDDIEQDYLQRIHGLMHSVCGNSQNPGMAIQLPSRGVNWKPPVAPFAKHVLIVTNCI